MTAILQNGNGGRVGIPTLYRGVRYRSRLEARWAAFFSLLGWPAYYEPFDLNGWIPDFVLHGRRKGCQGIAVEVKPVYGMDDPLFQATIEKIAASGWQGESLIVSYFLPRDYCDQLGIGWCREIFYDAPRLDVAVFQSTGKLGAEDDRGVGPDNVAAVVGYCHLYGDFTDRIGGYYYGGSTGGDEEEIASLWAQAGNEVQWAPPAERARRYDRPGSRDDGVAAVIAEVPGAV